MNHVGWFMAYAFRIVDLDEINFGSTTWRNTESDKEKPWDKIRRWNERSPDRTYVLLSWQKLTEDEFFEYDSET